MKRAPIRAVPSAAAPAAPLDERHLVDGLIARDRRAITDFLERTHRPVFCMACRLSADRELRRDWTHETILGVLDDVGAGRFVFRGPGSFWAWFRKRAYYRLLDEYRKHRKRRERESADGADGEARDLSAFPGAANPHRELERTELFSAFEECLRRLPNEDQRRALRLLLVEELAYQEIADVMRAPLNTVRAWIRRARLAVRKCLVAALGIGPGAAVGEGEDD